MKSQTVCGLRCWPDSCRCIKGLHRGNPNQIPNTHFVQTSIPKLEEPWTWARISFISMCLECRICITLSGCCKMHKKSQGFLTWCVRKRKREKPHTSSELFSSCVSCRMLCHSSRTAEVVCSFSANVTHTDKQTKVHIVYFNTTRNKRHCILGYTNTSTKCLKMLHSISNYSFGDFVFLLYSLQLGYVGAYFNKVFKVSFVNPQRVGYIRLQDRYRRSIANRSFNHGNSSLNRPHWKSIE